jgi:GDP-4-dehydro-6-deoxy-D-mannose reductase
LPKWSRPIWRGIGRGFVPEDEAPSGPILVTGAGGFVGGHLVRALRAAWPGAVVLECDVDVRDRAAVEARIGAVRPASCVHLAGIASIAQAARDQVQAWQVNLHGALHVADAILAHAPACQMVFASSADAYGASFRGGVALDEKAPLAPMNVYGATKAAADLALGSMAERGLRVVRLRPFNHIGAGQSPDFVVASFARQIARIRAGLQPPVLKVGRLDTCRDFLDVRDVCAAYVACIARRDALPGGVILNVASGVARNIGEVLRDMLAAEGVAAEIRSDPVRVRATDIVRACGDADLARDMLGWSARTPWADTLRSVLADWRGRDLAEGGATA